MIKAKSNYQYHDGARNELSDLLPESYTRVLEIGCGEGGFFSCVKESCEYWGIEPSKSAANISRQKLHTVRVGTYEDVSNEIPDNYFDLIICNDVIEHMVDHNQFLNSIKRKMTKDAYLIGSIPNVRYFRNLIRLLFEKDWKYKEAGILDYTHLRFFTKKSLHRCLIENKYTIDIFTGVNQVKLHRLFDPRHLFYRFFILVFGKDTSYKQFKFRIHQKSKDV